MARLVEEVPARDLHVVYFNRLTQEPLAVWSELVEFLGISAAFTPDFVSRNVSDKMYRSAPLHRLAQRPPSSLTRPVGRLRQWSRVTDAPLVARVKRAMWKHLPKPMVSDEGRREVTEYLRDDLALLGETLRIDLSGWAGSR